MITRVEVIDHRASSSAPGRMLVLWNVNAEISMQDGGRTLKVLVSDQQPSQATALTRGNE